MEFLDGRAFGVSFDLRARGLDEFSVVHARRTSSHARHAAETAIEVANPFRIHLRNTIARKFHEVNSAAGRIHLLSPHHISGTHRKTKAAVHAFVNDFSGRWVKRVEGANASRVCDRIGHYILPTNRLGFSVLFGSSRCFTARCKGRESPVLPQASNSGIFSRPWKRTREPPWPSSSRRKTLRARCKGSTAPSSRSHPIPVAYTSALHLS